MSRDVFEHGQLVYLQIPATDVATSARFYERVFGWRVGRTEVESGFEAPGLIGQWVTDRPPAPGSGPVMWIHVEDVARSLEEAQAAGAVLRQEPTPDGPRLLASFSDPAGNLVGIVSHPPIRTAVEDLRGPATRRSAAAPADIGISVMLIVPDAEAAVTWYCDALGAEVTWDLGGVAGLRVGDAPFFLHETNPDNPAEDSPDRVGQTSVRIEVFVDDPGALIERAMAAGARPGSPVTAHEMPWGTHRQGGFEDPFGHRWSVGDASPLRAGAA